MKQTELKPCAACGKGVMHAGAPQFYKITIQPHVVNIGAIQRQHGLEMMLGAGAGHNQNAVATVAFHMGSQEDIAVPFGEPVELLLCQDCGIAEQSIAALLEM